MARLAAVEQGLYYPTPISQIEKFFESHVHLNGRYATIFDPCAGEGIALKAIGEIFKASHFDEVKTYGIELEETRAKIAKDNGHVIQGAFEKCDITGSPDFIFMNPPYDYVNGKRVELNWIDAVSPLMDSNSYMLLVLPDMFFKGGRFYEHFRLCLYKNRLKPVGDYGEQIGGISFEPEEFKAFRQVFLLVRKVNYAEITKEISVNGSVGVTKQRHSVNFYEHMVSEITIIPKAEEAATSIFETYSPIDLFGKVTNDIPIRPLQPMRPEIIAAVIAGGAFFGIEMNDKLYRGGIKTVIDTTTVIKDDAKEEIQTPRMIATLSALDLKTGDLDIIESTEDRFGPTIEEVAKLLKDKITREQPSIYQEETDFPLYSKRFADIHAPREIAGRQNGLFPAQEHIAAMTLKNWKKGLRTTVIQGKMGTGKTIISIAAAVGYVRNLKPDAQKILLLLPSKDDLVRKWEEEIKLSCRDLKPKIFELKTISDVQEAFSYQGLCFILVKESMVKRTSGWRHIQQIKRKNGGTVCFRCGALDAPLFNKKEELPKKEDEVLHCSVCGVTYAQDNRDRNNNAFASLARYISNHYKRSYVLICDEAHQLKGGDSARGYASGSLMKAARRILLMTGTFYNGFASSMFYNLYRGVSTFRLETTYDGVEDFVRLYGLEQKVTRHRVDTGRYSYSGYESKATTRTKEIPGIHPAMIATMLPFTCYIKLEDLNFELPSKMEHTLFLDLEEDAKKHIDSYLEKIKSQAISDMKEKPPSMSMMGQFNWARNGAYDIYPIGEEVENGKFVLSPIQKDKLAPKEEAAIRIIQKYKKIGFPTLVYYLQTGRRPIQHRLASQCEKYGLKLVFMPETVKHRVEFIDDALKQGANAIICNPNLVKEGIDLLKFKSIIWYGVTDDAMLVDQANARIYRIGQDQPVEIFYLGYNKTYQSDRWQNTAKKVAAMSAAHGDVRQGLAALLGETDLISTVQDAMIDYPRVDSGITINDLPPIEIPTIEDMQTLTEVIIPKKNTVIEVESWYAWKEKQMKEKQIVEVPKPNRVIDLRTINPEQQSLF